MSGPGRNDPCPCGSGRKFKHCHGAAGAGALAKSVPPRAAAPGGADAVLAHALALHQRGALDEAEAAYTRVLAAQPGQYPAVLYLGIVRAQRGDWTAAVASFREAAKRQPREAAVHFNLGKALTAAGEPLEARRALARALDLKPASAETWNELGLAAQACGDAAEAEKAYRRAIALQPDYFEAWNNLGLLLLGRGSEAAAAEAVQALEKALLHSRGQTEVMVNMAMALKACGRVGEAEAIYGRVLEIDAGNLRALCNFGNLLIETDRPEEAGARYAAALRIDTASVDARLGIANVALRQNRLEDAERGLRDVLEAAPDSLEAQASLGIVLQRSNRLEEAEAFLRRAIAIQPDHAAASSALLFLLDHKPGISAQDLHAEHLRWGREVAGRLSPAQPVFPNPPDPERRLRVGYVSADFRKHAVSFFLEPLLTNHDRSRFETHCYYNDWPEDEVTARLRGHVDGFTRIAGLSDEGAAEIVRRDRIDLLIDLSGHTRGNRLLMFARRPAPVQATWLGYPNTTGLAAVDYRISDAVADPPGATERYFVERLVRLPNSVWCFQPGNEWPEAPPQPRSGAIVFGAANGPARIGPAVVAAWAEILRRCPGSRLKLFRFPEGGPRERMTGSFVQQGIAAERLEFAANLPAREFRAALADIDIVFDTFPLVGATGTCEALWMGAPVVTLCGSIYLERAGASLLSALGRREWIASSVDEYVEIATGLASDRAGLAAIRAGMRAQMRASPLMDVARYARDFETVLRAMWQAWCAAQGAARPA